MDPEDELILGHVAAMVVRFVLMVVGLGLVVTMTILPIGLPVGLIAMLEHPPAGGVVTIRIYGGSNEDIY